MTNIKNTITPNNELPIMLTIEEASRETGLASYLIRRMCWQGKVVTVKTGKKWLINKTSLIAFLTNGGTVS